MSFSKNRLLNSRESLFNEANPVLPNKINSTSNKQADKVNESDLKFLINELGFSKAQSQSLLNDKACLKLIIQDYLN